LIDHLEKAVESHEAISLRAFGKFKERVDTGLFVSALAQTAEPHRGIRHYRDPGSLSPTVRTILGLKLDMPGKGGISHHEATPGCLFVGSDHRLRNSSAAR
jgi:hypothetical protein